MSEETFTKGQSWGALKRCWCGYRISKVQDDEEKMKLYAGRINKIQRELGIAITYFDVLQEKPVGDFAL